LRFVVILALETVTRRGSVALSVDGVADMVAGLDTPTHGERLPAALLDMTARHGRTLRDVDIFVVVTGPGSFTGMRVGMAAVQGLALTTGRPVAGVPTLDAVARAAWESATTPGALLVSTVDGQRGDLFVAAFDTSGAASWESAVRVLEPQVTTPAELPDLLSRWADRPMVVAGDGAAAHAGLFGARLAQAVIVEPAMTLAEAAARIVETSPALAGPPHALRPVYLRRPDAVIARDRARRGVPASPYTIRRANLADDLASVEALQRQTFTNAWGAEAIRCELENTDVARLYVMHGPDGRLVAYCACWIIFDELHINSLAVDTARRRQGLARRLLAHVLDDAMRGGAASATLEVRSSNAPARALYEGLGFKVEGIRRDYYQEPREDAVILWTRDLRAIHGALRP
jgi:N6-L-threonylcarbamoyladenine synthase